MKKIIKKLRALTAANLELRNVPRSNRRACAIAKVQGLRETQYVTGCEYQLPIQESCRKCPHWSESRYIAAFGKYIVSGFIDGIKSNEEAPKE